LSSLLLFYLLEEQETHFGLISTHLTFILITTMKISSVLLAMVATTAAEQHISGQERVRKLLSGGRRLADDDGQAYDDEFSAEGIAEVEEQLMDYSIKLLKCEGGESLGTYDDDGNIQYGVAIVRACPSCSGNKQGGCTSGYADFAVPLSDFVEAYMEDQADNMNWDDQMNVANFAQCAEYEQEQNGDDDGGGASYYVGPACTSDFKNVKLGLFSDASCSVPSDESFEQISNGWTLPFSSGGLVSNQCLDCGYKGDDGVTYLKDMCAEIYEDSALVCEEWDIKHYYWDSITEVYRFGQDTTGCKRIAWMDKTPEPFSEWASVFAMAMLVVGSIAAAVWYTLWWTKRKSFR
jgi:hypothetical protein